MVPCRLARYFAGWLMSKHHLALDAALVAEERDRWEANAKVMADALEGLLYEEVTPVEVTKAIAARRAYVEWGAQ
jgi:hypothetical protein